MSAFRYFPSVFFLSLMASCAALPNLVLDDPEFFNSMVSGAQAGKQYNVGQEDYRYVHELLQSDRTDWRQAGVLLAAQTNEPELISAIIAALQDEQRVVWETAQEKLAEKFDEYRLVIIKELEEGDAKTKISLLMFLGTTDQRDVVPVIIRFFSNPNPDIRNHAALAVRNIVDSGDPFLQEALSSENPLTAATAYRALGYYKNPEYTGTFIRAFLSPYPEVQKNAQLGMVQLGRQALPRLHAEADNTENSYESRVAALNVIQALRLPESIRILMSLLRDSDERITVKTEYVLSTYGAAAVPPMTAFYEDSGEKNRLLAIRVLKNLKTKAALPAFAEALNDPSPTIRANAEEILRDWESQAWPILRETVQTETPYSSEAALKILRDGADLWFVLTDDGQVNRRGLFLLIKESTKSELKNYLDRVDISRLLYENIVLLKDAWDITGEFRRLENFVNTNRDPYVYALRQQELFTSAAKDQLRKSFEAFHSYLETSDQKSLEESKRYKEESLNLEAKAEEQRIAIGNITLEERSESQENLDRYRTLREQLIRTWEFSVPELRSVVEDLYIAGGLNPSRMIQESVTQN